MRYCCRRVTISVLLAASAVFGSVTGDESNEELRQLELRQREKSLFDEIHRDLHHMSMTPPPADPETVPRHQWESVSWKGKSGKKHHRNKHHKHSPKHSSPKKSKMKSSKKHGKGASSSYSKGYFSKGKGTGPIGKGTGVLPTPQPQPTMSPKPTEYGPTTSPGTPSRPTAPYSQPPVEPSTGMPSSVGGPTANTPPPYDGISYIPSKYCIDRIFRVST